MGLRGNTTNISAQELGDLRQQLLRQKQSAMSPDQIKLEELQNLKKVLQGQQDKSFGQKALETIGEAGEFIDRFTGAPTRAAISSLQEDLSEPLAAAEAFAKQFGRPSVEAPTGKEIATKAGLSTKETIDLPVFGKVSPAGMAGLGVDILADPLALVPAGAFGKAAGLTRRGVGAGAELAGKAAGAVARRTVPGAVMSAEKAAAFIADKFKPTISKDASKFLEIASKEGIELTDEVKDLIDFDKTSVINRFLRKSAEGVLGEKLSRGVRNAVIEVNNAVEKFKNKFSPLGEPIGEATAGDIIKNGLQNAKERLFDSVELTYDSLGRKMLQEKGFRGTLDDIDPVLLDRLNEKLAPIRKKAEDIVAFGGKRRKAEAQEILKFMDNIDKIQGDVLGLGLQLREVGENAFGKIIIGQPSINVKLNRDLYGALSDTLVDATAKGLGEEAAAKLVKANEDISKFFRDEGPIVKALRSDPAPEKLYKTLVLNGDTKKISSLREILAPEEFNALKNAFIDSISPKNIDELASFKSIFNTLKKSKRNIAEELFEPQEFGDLIDILKLGDRLNLPYMSSSGTGGSNSFLSVLKSIPDEVINEKILKSLKDNARGVPSEVRGELIQEAAASLRARPNKAFLLEAPARLLSTEQTNRRTPLERRLDMNRLRRQ